MSSLQHRIKSHSIPVWKKTYSPTANPWFCSSSPHFDSSSPQLTEVGVLHSFFGSQPLLMVISQKFVQKVQDFGADQVSVLTMDEVFPAFPWMPRAEEPIIAQNSEQIKLWIAKQPQFYHGNHPSHPTHGAIAPPTGTKFIYQLLLFPEFSIWLLKYKSIWSFFYGTTYLGNVQPQVL